MSDVAKIERNRKEYEDAYAAEKEYYQEEAYFTTCIKES